MLSRFVRTLYIYFDMDMPFVSIGILTVEVSQ